MDVEDVSTCRDRLRVGFLVGLVPYERSHGVIREA